jgi:hypothetical protein
MRLKNLFKILSACFLFCLAIEGLSQDKESLISQIENHEAVINHLSARRQMVLDNSGELARKINQLREKTEISAAEHRQLSQWMRESQLFQARIDSIDTETEQQRAAMNHSTRELIFIVDAEIERLALASEKEDEKSKTKRLENLQHRLDEKAFWESRLPRPDFPAAFSKNIEINEWDSPETIRYKGDLLLDRSDQLIEMIHEMDTRIKGLEKEARLRSRVEEFRGDIALFDQREFAVRAQPQSYENTRQTPSAIDEGESTYTFTAVDPLSSIYLDMAEEMRSPLPRSSALLDQWIKRLYSSRGILSFRADSLQNEARKMYEQADRKQER